MSGSGLDSLMDFAAFVEFSGALRATRSDLIDVAETRIAHALSELRPRIVVPEAFARVHRCHLAPVWCELHALPPAAARSAFACDGVRHGLELLFRAFAQEGRRVAIPSDVYPVYARIAAAAGVPILALETFPAFDLTRILAQATSGGASVAILPAPLKLHGRAWTAEEADVAARWLNEDDERRLVLDGVYAFGQPLDAPIQRLIATDQVYYLDSLSKGWLHELVFGMALVPERDRESLQDVFRALQPDQRKLFLARELMTRFESFPAQLASELGSRRAALSRRLREAGIEVRPVAQGYLVAIESDATALLAKHRVLALPASVFGSMRSDLSIGSALPTQVPNTP